MKMSDFKNAHGMFLIKTKIRKERMPKTFESLIQYLFKINENLDPNADFSVDVPIKWTTRKSGWIKDGYCVKTQNNSILRLTQKTFDEFESLIEGFEEFCENLKEYYEGQEKLAEALREYIDELKKLLEDLPRIMREASQDVYK